MPDRRGRAAGRRGPRCRARWSPISNRVTMPKLPPPPQTAQNRSGCSSALARTHRPSARRMSIATTLSEVRPQRRLSQPNPPPTASPATPGAADDARGSREAVDLGRGIEVGPDRAGLDADAAPLGIDHQAAHRREIDDDPALAQRRSRHVVPAAADRHRQPASRRGIEGDGGIVGVDAAGDQGRAAVDGAVPQPARVVVPGPIRMDQDALERSEWIHVAPSPGSMGGGRSKHNPRSRGAGVRLPREGGASGRGPGATRARRRPRPARRRSCGSSVRSR